MDADLASVLQNILQRLDLIEAQTHTGTQPTLPAITHVPEGDVAVTPTGVNANGVVRYWPKVIEKPTDPAHASDYWDIDYLAYLTRMQRTVNPSTGKMFMPTGMFHSAFFPPAKAENQPFPVQCDMDQHPGDWYTQAEVDMNAKLAARDSGANWIAQAAPAPVAVAGNVPIAGQ